MINFKFLSRLFIAATLVFFAACDKNDTADNSPKNTGMVDFTVKTSIPQTLLTYASHQGGATNVESENGTYDLRYIMEAWTVDEATPRLAYRGYRTVGEKFSEADVTFNVSLLAMKYSFVFWADFVEKGTTDVEQGTTEDLFYKTNDADPDKDKGLQAVVMTDLDPASYGISNDVRDAWYNVVDVDLTQTNYIDGVVLKRPFGKYRLIATDMGDFKLNPAEFAKIATVTYTGVFGSETDKVTMPSGFNALKREVLTTDRIDVAGQIYANSVTQEKVVISGTDYNGDKDALVLGFDYIFTDNSAQTVSFDVDVYQDAAQSVRLGTTRSLGNIPIKPNMLTTVYGNFFTSTGTITVSVDDVFGNTEEKHEIFEVPTVLSVQGGAYIKTLKLSDNISDDITVSAESKFLPVLSPSGNTLEIRIPANTTGEPRTELITVTNKTKNVTSIITVEQAEYIQLTENGPKWAVSNVYTKGTFATLPGARGQFYKFDGDEGREFNSQTTCTVTPDVAGNWTSEKNPSPAGWHVPTRQEYQNLDNMPNKWFKNTTAAWAGNNGVSEFLSYASGVWVGPDAETATVDNWGNAIFFPAGAAMASGGGLTPNPKWFVNNELRALYWTADYTYNESLHKGYVVWFQLQGKNTDGNVTVHPKEVDPVSKNADVAFLVRAVKD